MLLVYFHVSLPKRTIPVEYLCCTSTVKIEFLAALISCLHLCSEEQGIMPCHCVVAVVVLLDVVMVLAYCCLGCLLGVPYTQY
jgi:hypothetical protein